MRNRIKDARRVGRLSGVVLGLLATTAAAPPAASGALALVDPGVRQSALVPGIYISGPQVIEPGTAYTYQVTVVTNRSYQGAVLWFYSLDCLQRRVIRLAAHRAWHGSFATRLGAPGPVAYPPISASLVSPPTKQSRARVLYRAALQPTAAPTTLPAPVEPLLPPGSGTGCDQMGA
jgi:hypothetical protein